MLQIKYPLGGGLNRAFTVYATTVYAVKEQIEPYAPLGVKWPK